MLGLKKLPVGFESFQEIRKLDCLSLIHICIGLLNGDYGYSTAVGLFNSVVNVILLIFVNWVVKKLNDGAVSYTHLL